MRINLTNRILDFWFGKTDDNGLSAPEIQSMWWKGSAEIDQKIATAYQSFHQAITENGLPQWVDNIESALACILVLDQFSRQIYRGESRAFSQDEFAQELSLKWQSSSGKLGPCQKFFLFMPLMHSEIIEYHDKLAELLDAEFNSTNQSAVKEFWSGAKSAASQHRELVARFGRYPYRNKVLGRESAPEELKYIAQGGQTFGQ